MKNQTRPSAFALDEWASYADHVHPSVAPYHKMGHSYIVGCTIIARSKEVPLFYTQDMNALMMVGLDRYTIAPSEKVVVLPDNWILAKIMVFLSRLGK